MCPVLVKTTVLGIEVGDEQVQFLEVEHSSLRPGAEFGVVHGEHDPSAGLAEGALHL